MAMLDPILMLEFASASEWPDEIKYAKRIIFADGTPVYDPVNKSVTVTMGTSGRWGLPLEVTDATVNVTAEQANAGLVLGAGRDGTQTINLPTEGIENGAAVLILGYHEDISETNKITVVITGGTDGEITAVDGSLGYTWFKTRWVPT